MQMTFSSKPYHSGKPWWCSICFMIFWFLQTSTTWAQQAQEVVEHGFYDQAKHGWFWYEDPPLSKEQETISPEKTQKSRKQIPSLDDFTVDQLWSMHPDNFQELLNGLQKKAVQYPSEANILEYLSIQDIARRKALAYTNATQYVTQKYTNLFNINQVYPVAGPGVAARVQLQQEEIRRTIEQAGNDHALIFFVDAGCGFCESQARILEYFVDTYHWQIKTVDIARNPEAAVRFNITIPPTLLLIKRGQDIHMPITTGVITMSELERKLYRAIRTVQGKTESGDFLLYDYQKGSALDPASILNKGRQPWQRTN